MLQFLGFVDRQLWIIDSNKLKASSFKLVVFRKGVSNIDRHVCTSNHFLAVFTTKIDLVFVFSKEHLLNISILCRYWDLEL